MRARNILLLVFGLLVFNFFYFSYGYVPYEPSHLFAHFNFYKNQTTFTNYITSTNYSLSGGSGYILDNGLICNGNSYLEYNYNIFNLPATYTILIKYKFNSIPSSAARIFIKDDASDYWNGTCLRGGSNSALYFDNYPIKTDNTIGNSSYDLIYSSYTTGINYVDAFVYNLSNLKVYRLENGQFTLLKTLDVPPVGSNNLPLYLCALNYGLTQTFNGSISVLDFWNVSLTPQQLLQAYNSYFTLYLSNITQQNNIFIIQQQGFTGDNYLKINNGNYTYIGTGNMNYTLNLLPGTYNLSFKAVNESQNITLYQNFTNVTIKPTYNQLVMGYTIANYNFSNATNVITNAKQLYLPYTSNYPGIHGCNIYNNNQTYNYIIGSNNLINISQIPDGTYNITCYLYNETLNLNLTENFTNFTIDRTPPTIVANNFEYNNGFNISLDNYINVFDTHLKEYTITLNKGSDTLSFDSNSNLTHNLNLLQFFGNIGAAGNYSIIINAEDKAGNKASKTINMYVNPNQEFKFVDKNNNPITDFLINGVEYTNYYSKPLFSIGLGLKTFNFTKEGYLNTLILRNLTLNSSINETIKINAAEFNIYLYNRTNFVLLNNVSFEIYIISPEFRYSLNTTTGGLIFPSINLKKGTYEVIATNPQYSTEKKYFYFNGIANYTINLFPLYYGDQSVGVTNLQVYNQYYQPLQGAIVELLQFDPQSNTFVDVSEDKTQNDGTAFFVDNVGTKLYKWRILYDNQIIDIPQTGGFFINTNQYNKVLYVTIKKEDINLNLNLPTNLYYNINLTYQPLNNSMIRVFYTINYQNLDKTDTHLTIKIVKQNVTNQEIIKDYNVTLPATLTSYKDYVDIINNSNIQYYLLVYYNENGKQVLLTKKELSKNSQPIFTWLTDYGILQLILYLLTITIILYIFISKNFTAGVILLLGYTIILSIFGLLSVAVVNLIVLIILGLIYVNSQQVNL